MNHLALALGEQAILPVAGAVAVGALALVLLTSANRTATRAKALRTAEVVTPYQVASQSTAGPVLCEMPGAAATGPSGPLIAPLSGRPCVWYHLRVSERRQRVRQRVLPNALGTRYGATFVPIREESSAAPFSIVDRNVRATVHPQGIMADFVPPAGVPNDGMPSPRTVYRYEPVQRNPLADLATNVLAPRWMEYVVGYLYEEWCVTEGMPVFVLGQARADRGVVELGQPADGPFVLSVTPPQQQVARASSASRAQYTITAIALGLTVATLAVLLAVSR